MKRREFIAGLGGAAVWPLLVRAQQQTKPIIGYLDGKPGGPPREYIDGFRRGLAEFGFSEGRDVTIEYHTVDDHIDRLPELAADVVRRRPAAITAAPGTPALAAKAATREIPIIFAVGDDPVELPLKRVAQRFVTCSAAKPDQKCTAWASSTKPNAVSTALIASKSRNDTASLSKERCVTER